jgi:hypothetical protein
MIKYAAGVLTVEEYTSASQVAGLDVIRPRFGDLNPQGAQTILGTCFICTKQETYGAKSPKNILVLDAFSQEDQFLQYHPIVWFPYSLCLFGKSGGEPEMCCYGVSNSNK